MISKNKTAELSSLNIPVVTDEPAKLTPEQEFLVTRIGCGIAGYSAEEIAPLFREALRYENVVLPEDFVAVLQKKEEKPN